MRALLPRPSPFSAFRLTATARCPAPIEAPSRSLALDAGHAPELFGNLQRLVRPSTTPFSARVTAILVLGSCRLATASSPSGASPSYRSPHPLLGLFLDGTLSERSPASSPETDRLSEISSLVYCGGHCVVSSRKSTTTMTPSDVVELDERDPSAGRPVNAMTTTAKIVPHASQLDALCPSPLGLDLDRPDGAVDLCSDERESLSLAIGTHCGFRKRTGPVCYACSLVSE